MRNVAAVALVPSVFILSLAAPTQLPNGNVVVAYQDWQECDDKSITAAQDGVNVLIWFAIDMGQNSSGMPAITGGPDWDCVANITKTLRDLKLETTHLISVGGWDRPHPDTNFSATQWWAEWKRWNSEVVARPALGFAGFDGFDWDLEGVNEYQAPDNFVTLKLLNLIGEMSTLAKQEGYVTTLAPIESYLDSSSNTFDWALNHYYSEWYEWNSTVPFPYHGQNSLAYVVAKYPDAFDLIMVQLYESWSHADFQVNVMQISPESYYEEWARRMMYGWWIWFSYAKDPVCDLPSQHVRVPADKLVVGLANGWTGGRDGNIYPNVTKQIFIWPEHIGKAWAALKASSGIHIPGTNLTTSVPRGAMFWNIRSEGAVVPDGSNKTLRLAKELNKFLNTRPALAQPAASDISAVFVV